MKDTGRETWEEGMVCEREVGGGSVLLLGVERPAELEAMEKAQWELVRVVGLSIHSAGF